MTLITKNLTSRYRNSQTLSYWKGRTRSFIGTPLYKRHLCSLEFVDEPTARKSADTIYQMFCRFKKQRDFIGMDMARKFLEMGFTRARRYANHSSGRKYDKMSGKVRPQESDWRTNTKAKSATILRKCRFGCIRPYIQRDEKGVAF